jgi:hypothetical protein
MTYEIYSNALNRTIGAPYATEAEAHQVAARMNSARHGNPARHWSKKVIVRPVSLASMQTVGAA